jgi:branched-chain amino acid transport system permease protein
MVYGILKLLNFAHGDVYMVGAYIGYGWITVFGGSFAMHLNPVLILLIMFPTAMLGCGLLGVMIERFAYRRLRNAPRIAPLITALGVSFFLENAAQLIVGAQQQQYNPYGWLKGPIALHGWKLPTGVLLSYSHAIIIGGTIVLMVALTWFVLRTQTGKAMRAVSFDREAAAMMGIDVDRVIVTTFFIGSALAGAAGVFNGIEYSQVFPTMGFQAGLYAFIAAVVGGIGNLPGAVLGGLAIGLAQSFSIGYISSQFSDAVVFAILIAVMIARPSGLLGRAAVQKV